MNGITLFSIVNFPFSILNASPVEQDILIV